MPARCTNKAVLKRTVGRLFTFREARELAGLEYSPKEDVKDEKNASRFGRLCVDHRRLRRLYGEAL